MSPQLPDLSGPPVSLTELTAYKDSVTQQFGAIYTAIDGLTPDSLDLSLVDDAFSGLKTVRNIVGHLGLDEARSNAERVAGMAYGAMQNARDVVSLIGQLPTEVAALESMATEAFDNISEILPSLPMSLEDLSAFKDTVFDQFGAIGDAIGSFSLDSLDLSLPGDIFSGLTNISNITGLIGLDDVGAYADKAVGMAYGAMQAAQDIASFIDEIPVEVANLGDMVMDGFDQVAETIAGLGDAFDELGDVPDLALDLAAYNPALDTRVGNLIPHTGIGSFGEVLFQVSAEKMALVRDVQRTTSARVEEHQVTGAKPRLEFLAPELDTTGFSVFWHMAFGVNPRTEIAKLRNLCTQGAAKNLILGGENFGKYLLIEVSERWMRSGPGGSPIVAEASLSLKEYV